MWNVGLVMPPNGTHNKDGFYGRVAYTHGAALDQPLALIRMDYGFNYPWDPEHSHLGPQLFIPHADWRGQYREGTVFTNHCVRVLKPTVNDTDPPTYQDLCMEVTLPGREMSPFRRTRNTSLHGPASWMGELLDNQRDASGLLYMRNRYYDPQTGRFTQEDPIGLAGGLNLYGFANGDPVGYSDPYGLSAEACCTFSQETGISSRQAARDFRHVVNRHGVDILFGGGVVALEAWGARLLSRAISTRAAGNAALTAASRFAPIEVDAGSTFYRKFQFEGVSVEVAVEAKTVGRVLQVDEVAFYPEGRAMTTGEFRYIRNSLETEAKERGYTGIRGQYHRTNTGRVFSLDKDF